MELDALYEYLKNYYSRDWQTLMSAQSINIYKFKFFGMDYQRNNSAPDFINLTFKVTIPLPNDHFKDNEVEVTWEVLINTLYLAKRHYYHLLDRNGGMCHKDLPETALARLRLQSAILKIYELYDERFNNNPDNIGPDNAWGFGFDNPYYVGSGQHLIEFTQNGRIIFDEHDTVGTKLWDGSK